MDTPFNPISVALGAEATFVARTLDSDRRHLTATLAAAAAHRGAALVEIYQNCPIFNDDAYAPLKDPASRAARSGTWPSSATCVPANCASARPAGTTSSSTTSPRPTPAT